MWSDASRKAAVEARLRKGVAGIKAAGILRGHNAGKGNRSIAKHVASQHSLNDVLNHPKVKTAIAKADKYKSKKG